MTGTDSAIPDNLKEKIAGRVVSCENLRVPKLGKNASGGAERHREKKKKHERRPGTQMRLSAL
jgi:hypothetical protein